MKAQYTTCVTDIASLDEELDYELAAILRERPDVEWSEDEYLGITDSWNHPIEFDDGIAEVLGAITTKHQASVMHMLLTMMTVEQRIGGKVLFGIRVRLWHLKYRIPDIVFLLTADDPRIEERYFEGADLVVEVISDSPQDRKRDLVTKRREYARAGILEYWIVDPQDELITVLQLKEQQYVEHGVYTRGETATSALMSDLRVDVSAVFDAM